MNIAIIGSGRVAQTIGKRLIELGHDVTVGTRNPEGNDSLRIWLKQTGDKGKVATLEQAAAAGELVINATQGTASIAALSKAGESHLAGKILLDLANQLDDSSGSPRTLATDQESLAEKIQRAFPKTKVVKTLNTVTANLMLSPQQLRAADHTIFVCGNDQEAKTKVSDLLRSAGWKDILDLGDISAARGTEMLMSIWLRLWGVLGTPMFNFKVVRQ